MKSYFLLLVFCGEAAGQKIFTCGDGGKPCRGDQACHDGKCIPVPFDGEIGGVSNVGVSAYTTVTNNGWLGDRDTAPRHIASPTAAGKSATELNGYDNWAKWKTDLGDWKKWTTAARSNKNLHWEVIMGTMYTKHIEKEQKTLERLSNDVKSQLNSMYLGKGAYCATTNVCTITRNNEGRITQDCNGFDTSTSQNACQQLEYTAASRCQENKKGNAWNDPVPGPGCRAELDSDGLVHSQSPIQISMRDTKSAYTALVSCLRASVSKNSYPTYLDLAQHRGENKYNGHALHDEASFGEDADLNTPNSDNEKTDYLLLLKTRQAHYNLQSSYECSNEEMNFEVRLYKMSKLENRYKLLYLYCKCDLTTQIKKFKKMVQTLCDGAVSGVEESGHCYSGGDKTTPRGARVETTQNHRDFLTSIANSECDIDDLFCPERVFYFSSDGVNTHPAAPCSQCVDLGGKHSEFDPTARNAARIQHNQNHFIDDVNRR